MEGGVGFKKEGESTEEKVYNWKANGIGEVRVVGLKWKGKEGKKASDQL